MLLFGRQKYSERKELNVKHVLKTTFVFQKRKLAKSLRPIYIFFFIILKGMSYKLRKYKHKPLRRKLHQKIHILYMKTLYFVRNMVRTMKQLTIKIIRLLPKL